MTARRAAADDATPFHADAHDHGACIDSALDRASSVCAARGARLTRLRRDVLELVWRGHAPIGAYDILAQLKTGDDDKPGRAAPPTVYRALDFLMEHGLVHRIESLNAYVGCDRPGESHVSQFLICSSCGATAELDDEVIAATVLKKADRLGFTVERQTIELRGTCPNCRRTKIATG